MATRVERARHRLPLVTVIVSLSLLAMGCAADEAEDPVPSEAAAEPSETDEDAEGHQVAVDDEDGSDTQAAAEPVAPRHWAAWMCDELAAPAVEAGDVISTLDLLSRDWTENEARLAADAYRSAAVMLEHLGRAGEQAPPLQDGSIEQFVRRYAAHNLDMSVVIEQLATEIDQAPSVQEAEAIHNDATSLSTGGSDSPSVAQMDALRDELESDFESIDQSLSDAAFDEFEEAIERSSCGQEVWSWYFGGW